MKLILKLLGFFPAKLDAITNSRNYSALTFAFIIIISFCKRIKKDEIYFYNCINEK